MKRFLLCVLFAFIYLAGVLVVSGMGFLDGIGLIVVYFSWLWASSRIVYFVAVLIGWESDGSDK